MGLTSNKAMDGGDAENNNGNQPGDGDKHQAQLPSVEVRYDLSYTLKLPAEQLDRVIPNVARSVAGIATAPLRAARLIKALATGDDPSLTPVPILKDCKGVLRPGTTTLLLSPPGHGKTSLLRALAGRLPGAAGGAVDGTLQYNGAEILPGPGGKPSDALTASSVNTRMLAQYTEQLDVHLPFLTVRETLQFAWANQTVEPSEALMGAAAAAAAAKVEATIKLLKLTGCADTRVGNESFRGVSGGERKRVTIGETLVSNARLLCMDEISTGLDASVTYEICAALADWARESAGTVVVALLQPTPEAVGTFDEIILLMEGGVVYHGPRVALPDYLCRLGFTPPTESGADLADWLIDFLVSPRNVYRKALAEAKGADSVADLQALDDLAAGAPPKALFTAEGLTAAWRGSAECAGAWARVGAAAERGLALESPLARAQYGQRYPRSGWAHFKLVLARQSTLTWRNWLLLAGRGLAAILIGIIMGITWFKTNQGNFFQLYGLMITSILQIGFTNTSELPFSIYFKNIANRQLKSGMYPTWTYPIAGFCSILSITIVETIVFSIIVYFMSDLNPDGGSWAFFTLILWLANVALGGAFRAVSYISPSFEVAFVSTSPLFAVQVVFTGFICLPSNMGTIVHKVPWMQFLYYSNPLAYALRSLGHNEFRSARYLVYPATNLTAASILADLGTPIQFPGSALSLPYFAQETCGWHPELQCASKTLSSTVLDALQISSKAAWKWGGVGFLVFFTIMQMDAGVRMLDFYNPVTNVGTSRSRAKQDDGDEDHAVAVPLEKSVLPFTPMSVAWRGLKYTVTLADGTSRALLNGISGVAEPGRTMALMGASGAGKTTLLDVLAGRKTAGRIEGDIFLNGRPRDEKSFARLTAYCEQMDVHNTFSTVREALHFSAALRLSTEIAPATRLAFVEEVIGLLELNSIADRLIGEAGAADALSPGQRKLLTISVELCANTPILFLDEPTSGLDARAAALVIKEVKKVAATGRTVITTIHQPNSDIFFTFDSIVLLQKGGWMGYVGPTGHHGKTMVAYVQTIPGARPCPHSMNPASWVLDVLSGSNSSGDGHKVPSEGAAVALTDGRELQARLLASDAWAATGKAVEAACAPAPGSQPFAFDSVYARSFADQLRICAARAARSLFRNTGYVFFRMMMVIGLMLFWGTTYYKIKPKVDCRPAAGGDQYQCDPTQATISSLVAGIPFAALFTGFLTMSTALPALFRERDTFYRERFSKMYAPEAHALSYFLAELPWIVIGAFAYYTPLYFMLGFPPSAGKYFFFVLVMGQNLTLWMSVGQWAAAHFPSADVAQVTLSTIVPLAFLFCGVFQPKSLIPWGASTDPANNHPHVFMRWLYYLDPVSYVLEGLIPMVFVDQASPSNAGHLIAVPDGFGGVSAVSSYSYVVSLYGRTYQNRFQVVGILACFTVGFQVLHLRAIRTKIYLNR